MNDPDTHILLHTITEETLAQENRQYVGTGGVSANNRDQGFVPAFLDTETGNVYRSRFPDGRPAPIHVLAGLPGNLIDTHGGSGATPTIKCSVISGFLNENAFYSREEARQATASGYLH